MKVLIMNVNLQAWYFRYIEENYILFSCLDLLVSVYLNANKKYQFFQIKILPTTKINPPKITKIWPSTKRNSRKKIWLGTREKTCKQRLISRKVISAKNNFKVNNLWAMYFDQLNFVWRLQEYPNLPLGKRKKCLFFTIPIN